MRKFLTREQEQKKREEELAAFQAFVETISPLLADGETLQAVPSANVAYLRAGDTDTTIDTTHIGVNCFVRLRTQWSRSECPRFALKTVTAEKLLATWRQHRLDEAAEKAARREHAAAAAEAKAAGTVELGFPPFGEHERNAENNQYLRDLVGITGLREVVARRDVTGVLRYRVRLEPLSLSADQVQRLLALLREHAAEALVLP